LHWRASQPKKVNKAEELTYLSTGIDKYSTIKFLIFPRIEQSPCRPSVQPREGRRGGEPLPQLPGVDVMKHLILR
jgi:hypothetical protein